MISTRIPFPLTSGVRIKNYYLAKALKDKGYSVDLLLIGFEKRSLLDPNDELESIFENIIEFNISRSLAVYNIFLGLLSRMPFQCCIFQSRDAQVWLKENHEKYLFCHFMLLRTYSLWQVVPYNYRLIDLADILSSTFNQLSKTQNNFIRRILYKVETYRLKELEEKVFNDPGIKTLFNYNEVQEIPEMFNVRHVLHGTRMTRVQINRERLKRKSRSLSIGFIGNLAYEPNLLTIEFITRALSGMEFDWKLVIVGANPTEKLKKEILSNPQLTLISDVENIEDALVKFDVLYAPVISGGGIQNKILESLAMGIPVLTNYKGASAFLPQIRKYMFVADSLEEQKSILKDIHIGKIPVDIDSMVNEMRRYYDWDTSANSYLEAFHDCR